MRGAGKGGHLQPTGEGPAWDLCVALPGEAAKADMSACRATGGFHIWDYVVFAAMLLISAAIGIYYAFAGGGQKTSKEFLMGGRSMSALPVALSLTASFMSAVTVLGTPAEVYRFGARFTLFAITYTLVIILSAEVFLPVFYRLGITSTYEVGSPQPLRPLWWPHPVGFLTSSIHHWPCA